MISDMDIKRAYIKDQALANQVHHVGVDFQALRLAQAAKMERMQKRGQAACHERLDEIMKERRVS